MSRYLVLTLNSLILCLTYFSVSCLVKQKNINFTKNEKKKGICNKKCLIFVMKKLQTLVERQKQNSCASQTPITGNTQEQRF